MAKNVIMKREFSRVLKEMVKEQPLESIAVLDLSRECEVSRGTFYNHFLDIYDLINWTFETDIIKPLQSYIASHDERWSGITVQCLEKMYADKDFYCQAVRNSGQNCLKDYMRERNYDSWKMLIASYMGTDKTCDKETLEFFERFTSQAIANMVIEWAEGGMEIPPEKMALMDCVATRGIYGMIDAENG